MLAQVGDVISFKYKENPGGWPMGPRMIKILSVRDTESNPVLASTVRKSYCVQRNRYLVTGKTAEGQIRSFYTDCIEPGAKRLGWFTRFTMWLTGSGF